MAYLTLENPRVFRPFVPVQRPRVVGCDHGRRNRVRAVEENHGSDEIDFKSLSPEARKIFKEAQENILALNSARMRALKELKSAHERIADLEHKLEEIASSLADRTTEGDDDIDEGVESNEDLSSAFAVGSGQSRETKEAPVDTIVLFYETGWETAFVHHQTDDKPWTQLPGDRMAIDPENGRKVFKICGHRMEFVLTNGTGKFDTPNPYGEPNKPRNYLIDGPGIWELKRGDLTRIHR